MIFWKEMSNICNVICEFITKNKRINGGRELLENMVNAFLKKFFENITKTNIIENSHFICCSATVIVTLLDLYLNKEAQVLEFVNLSKVKPLIYAKKVTILYIYIEHRNG